jgi:hypothetical protein
MPAKLFHLRVDLRIIPIRPRDRRPQIINLLFPTSICSRSSASP